MLVLFFCFAKEEYFIRIVYFYCELFTRCALRCARKEDENQKWKIHRICLYAVLLKYTYVKDSIVQYFLYPRIGT